MPEASMPPPPLEEEGRVKGFRLKPSEEALIEQLIKYAYMAGLIKEKTFQAYMMFCLNCGYARLHQDFKGISKR